ncbi:hypothetical protein [Nocardioides lijunqiniae]|uniref:hypothetical protein n=1 Tax=Nocardioides lijunqiniae TaxID=2760832 RepID=UPI001878B2D8|nr:hypothetical protein [Nocardioides lijunqiniae]
MPPVDLVEIVNPANGRKGIVSATSRAATAYKRPPSARTGDAEPVQPAAAVDPRLGEPLELPAKNASTEAWVEYATHPATPNGLSSDEAAQMGRDDLAARFHKVQED